MEHFIKLIEINNFKSFKHIELEGFKRINLIIGKPNVGKSNFLESLGLFSIPYVCQNRKKKLSDLIRFKNYIELFNNVESKNFSIVANKLRCTCDLKYNSIELNFDNMNFPTEMNIYEKKISIRPIGQKYICDSKFNLKLSEGWESLSPSIKRYTFNSEVQFHSKSFYDFLSIPFGTNLVGVLESYPNLKKQFEYWFKQYGLRLVLDKTNHSLKVLKDKDDEGVFLLPYSSIADTLQRIIFYKTAIASNKDSVLIFEEPEAHAFPPYIVEFTQDVINSTTNQFFISTHSPIVLNDFLENAREELAIYMVDFKNGQTVMKELSRDDIDEVYKYGVDLFFNYENYLA